MIRLDLYATATGELLASYPLAGAAVVNPVRRLIGGLSVPWNVPGTPSVGPAIFRPGSVQLPADLAWAKHLVEHDSNRSAGYLIRAAETAAGLLTVAQLVDGPLADDVLAGVQNRTRDGLSVRVEVDRWNRLADDTLEIVASRLREVSSVAVPAYAPARASVLAALPPTERETIMAELRQMLDLTASAPGTPQDPPPPAPSPGNPDGGPAPEPSPTVPPQGAPGQALAGLTATVDPAALAAALAPHLARVQIPAIEVPAPPPSPPARRGFATVSAAAVEVARWQSEGRGNIYELSAALNDVVPANDAGGGAGTGNDVRPQWLGELWTARQSRRRYVDALGTPSRLTGMKAKGWRWVTRPEVDDYAGDKAAIPSNAVSTEPAEADAHRTAGGWDVDRVFFDLGDPAFIEALFQAAAEDYAIKSDAWLAAQLMAAAVAFDADGLGASASLVAALGAMGAAAAGIGASVSWLAVAPDIFGDFAGLTRDEVPWWLGAGNADVSLGNQDGAAGGFSFWADPALAAGTYIGGDRRAATYFEEGATPIRVQAVNIPNGGVDLGVFGYNSVIVNDERALYHGTIA